MHKRIKLKRSRYSQNEAIKIKAVKNTEYKIPCECDNNYTAT